MADLIHTYIERLFEREGYFSNHAADKGGATAWGITRATLAFWRKHVVSVEEVKALTQAEAAAIYRALYFDNHRIGLLPDEVEEQVFDFGVNSGPQVAIQALQECLSIKADGAIGPTTVAATLVACRPDGGRALNRKLAVWRAMMIARIVRRDPSQVAFLAGWLRRTLDFIK